MLLSSRRIIIQNTKRMFCTGGGGDYHRTKNSLMNTIKNEIGPSQKWIEIFDDETGKRYWWCEETDEVTALDASRPDSWREVRTDDGDVYFWNENTDETTAIGEPRPRLGEKRETVLPSSSSSSSIKTMVMQGAGLGLGFGIVGLIFSDSRLKYDISRTGCSTSGIPTYLFRYRNDPEKTLYSGVMAQDLLFHYPRKDAVFKTSSSYLAVDYSKIDVDFVKLT